MGCAVGNRELEGGRSSASFRAPLVYIHSMYACLRGVHVCVYVVAVPRMIAALLVLYNYNAVHTCERSRCIRDISTLSAIPSILHGGTNMSRCVAVSPDASCSHLLLPSSSTLKSVLSFLSVPRESDKHTFLAVQSFP